MSSSTNRTFTASFEAMYFYGFYFFGWGKACGKVLVA